MLIFSCLPGQLSEQRLDASGPGAIWCVPGDSVLGPFDTSRAVPLTGEDLYSGRLVRDRAGQWVMLAFRNLEAGGFVGEISDPMPVSWAADGSGLTRSGRTYPDRGRSARSGSAR